MSNRGHVSQQGFSLIEILIVLVVVGILATFAFLALGNSGENLDRQNIARSFKVALERARFDSVKRHPANCADQARVELTSPTSFDVVTDQDQNGTLNVGTETRTVDFGNRGNTSIVTPDVSSIVVFRFDAKGQVTSGPCNAQVEIPSTVTFCQLPCSTPDSTNSSVIFISPTGTAAYLNGGSTVPTFSDPTIGNVNTTMNPMLAVWDLIVGTPTPTPSPGPSGTPSTPTPTPTPTPTGSPTATPSGTATPTPTATPTATPSGTATPTPSPSATPAYCADNTPPVGCICGPDQHLQAGKCRRNH